MRNAMVALIGVGVLLTAGCGTDDSAQDSTITAGPEAAPTVYRVGQDVESGGLVVNVRAVRSEGSVPVRDGDLAAPEGQKYVVLDAEVTNGAEAGLDLSCGTVVGHRLVDTQKRRFDVIPGLDAVPGNRACADLVPSGAAGQITWVFEVPADSTPAAFGFYDTAGQQPTDAKVVDLTAG